MAGGAAWLLAACQAAAPAIIQPRGPAAEKIAFLWWVMFGLGTAIWVGVLVFLGLGLWKRRHVSTFRGDEPPPVAPEEDHPLPGRPVNWVIGGGIVMPVIVLTTLFGLTLWTMRAIANVDEGELEIEVIGHQFWWEVHYPGYDFVTANEIHIPVDRRVSLRLTTADVIHSFWVPELHGKVDLNPGMVTSLAIEANRPGIYRGECAEFCGIQHAKMHLLVIADEPEVFDAWVALQQQPAAEPETEITQAGQEVFLNSQCVYCHTIRGTPANGDLGPDLTHLASRNTLAAATIPNTRGHLGGWIADPQSIKPGNLMPPTILESEDLQALLSYLQSLQ